MEKLPEINKEKLKEGCNIEVHVLFSRHAEKDSHGGNITKVGEEASQAFGKKLQRLSSMKGYNVEPTTHSGHDRTERTAHLIDNPNENLENIESPSGKKATEHILNSSIDRYSKEADEKYAELAAGNYSLEGDAVEYFAKLNNKRYEENTPSSVEMSQAIANDILRIVESTKTMPSDSKKFLPNIVHSGVFEHFLLDLLKKRNEEKPVDSIGGPLNFLGFDDFRLYIKRKNPDDVRIQFRFRERNENGTIRYYEITEGELKNLAEIKN